MYSIPNERISIDSKENIAENFEKFSLKVR